jgi:hypothetical protein
MPKIHKGFVDLLLQKRVATYDALVGMQGLCILYQKMIKTSTGSFQAKTQPITSLNEIDNILYTIDYLVNKGLIKVYSPGTPQNAFHIGDALKNKILERDYDKMIFLNGLNQEYWGKQIQINFSLFDFKNNGYQTYEQRQSKRNLWLPIWAVILASLLSGLSTVLFEKLLGLH